jgi:hypothetical protein
MDALYPRHNIRLTAGRNAWVCRSIEKQLTTQERAELGPLLRDADEAATAAVRSLALRKRAKANIYGPAAKEADRALDAVLGAIYGQLQSLGRVYESSGEEGARVARIAAVLFPAPLEDVANAAYPDELAEAQRILAASKEAAVAADVAEVPGLGALVTMLEARTARFAEALEREKIEAPSYASAQAEVEAAERRMAEVVMAVLVRYRGDGAEAAARRAELLEPYARQQDDMRQRFRRRLPPGELDAATGELIEEDASDAALPAEPEPEPAE